MKHNTLWYFRNATNRKTSWLTLQLFQFNKFIRFAKHYPLNFRRTISIDLTRNISTAKKRLANLEPVNQQNWGLQNVE